MRDGEAFWMKVIGVLLTLLGLTLLPFPEITYTAKETVIHSDSADIKANRQKTIVVPRPLSIVVIGAGVLALFAAARNAQE